MKLANKILILITVPAAMVLAVEGYLFTVQTQHVLTNQIENRLMHDLTDVEEKIINADNMIIKDTEVVSRHPAIHRALSLQESLGINQIMNELASIYRYYNYLMIVDTEGYIFAVNTRDNKGNKIDTEQLLGKNVGESVLYVKPSPEKTVIGNPAFDPFLRLVGLKPGISQWFVTPITERGENVLGWLIFAFDWQKETLALLRDSAVSLRSAGNKTAEVLLISEDRKIVLGAEKPGEKIPLAGRVIKEKPLKLGNADMKLIISYDEAETRRPIAILRLLMMTAILFFSLLTAALLYMLLHKTLLERLMILDAGAEELSKGNLEYSFPDIGSDEVGKLGLTLNKMGRRLASAVRSLRESEERFRGAFETSATGMAITALDGKWLQVNRSLCDLVGRSEQEMLGRKFQDITHPDDLEGNLENVRRLIAGEISYYHTEKRYFHRDGHVVWIRLSASLVRDPEGNPLHFVAQMQDITARKLAEEEIRLLNVELEGKVEERTRQLREAQEELVRSEKLAMLGLIAGGIGNELRNPLGVMNNAVFFLKSIMPDADETVRDYLGIIEQEIENSKGIISSLLDFYTVKAPQTRAVSIHELISRGLEGCAVPQNVSLRFELSETLPMVSIDLMQMGQVLQNLITNAVQAMPEGGALRISAKAVQKLGSAEARDFRTSQLPSFELDADFIEISVADTGAGIAPEDMERLFQPLFTTKSRGLGLGLALSRKLTEANGGRIDAGSETGKGTTFTVILPVDGNHGTVGMTPEIFAGS